MSKKRPVMGDLMAQDAYTIPSPWPVPPGHAPLRVVPPNERDTIERLPRSEGYDANAIRGEDVMQQYFWPPPQEEDI
jgi:hypothetical protein